MTASILVVCTGNICRSPAIERLLRARLGDAAGLHVESAGTHAMVGEPIAQPMADLLADHEIPISGFAARQLRPDMIEDASLIVAAARDHRSAVVRLVPGAVHRTFTLLELARLTSTLAIPAAEDLVARVEALPARAAGQRSMHLNHRDPDDIIDPYRRRRPVYRKSFAAIDDAVTRLVAALTSDRVRQRR